jgi:neutral ceramidase
MLILGARSVRFVFAMLLSGGLLIESVQSAEPPIHVGVAQAEITPPLGFPMAGYYHERLATATKDPLWAKAVVFQQGDVKAAWVVCDVTGISVDFSHEVRRRTAEKTGIPYERIVVSATHSHTAPDYTRSLYRYLGPADEIKTDVEKGRAAYAGQLIEKTVQAIVDAQKIAGPAVLRSGSARQQKAVSFSRRFVMRDGSVKTWVGLKNPDALRTANPIDPEIALLQVQKSDGSTVGMLSNFALHLDTVGGSEWSADYPFALEQTVRKGLGPDVVSLFGTGCCGDINHVDSMATERLKSTTIGQELGATILGGLSNLEAVEAPRLQAHSRVVNLRLQEAPAAVVQEAFELCKAANSGQKVEFFQHVAAYKAVVLDQLLRKQPTVNSAEVASLGLSRLWGGIGETIPAEVNVFTLGDDVAIVFLPGEVFVELGLAIKEASPFRTTLVVELSQCVETVYIPTRVGSVGGGYEVTNSFVERGSGELLVEAAVGLLREAATANTTAEPAK